MPGKKERNEGTAVAHTEKVIQSGSVEDELMFKLNDASTHHLIKARLITHDWLPAKPN